MRVGVDLVELRPRLKMLQFNRHTPSQLFPATGTFASLSYFEQLSFYQKYHLVRAQGHKCMLINKSIMSADIMHKHVRILCISIILFFIFANYNIFKTQPIIRGKVGSHFLMRETQKRLLFLY